MTRPLIAAVLLLTSAAAWSSGGADSARHWLAKSHQAAGGAAWDGVTTTRARFEIELPGMGGHAEIVTDLATGRYVSDATVGTFRFVTGMDDSVQWSQDPSGQVQAPDSQGEREASVSERYRRMLAYWYPERWPAELSDLGSAGEDERVFRRIRIVPEGGRAFVVWIEEQTALIDRIVENDGSRDETIYLYDYHVLDGRQIPYATRFSTGETQYDQFTMLQSIEFNVELPADAFAMPGLPPPDYRFTNDVAETTVPFRLRNNHTYVEVMFNGQGPFNVILDTGGANVITRAVAAKLGIETQGQMGVRGVGEQSQEMALAQLDSVTIGEVMVKDQLFYVIDFDELSRAEGLTVDGLVGYEVFKRFAVRLDYGGSRLTLIEPAGFSYSGGGTAVKFEFDGHTPVVDGAIDGIAGKLTFDTGSRSHVSLHAPFVERHGLLARYPEAVEGINGWGVGGPSRSRVLRGTSLRIGDDIVIREPIMSLSLQQRGAMTDRYQIANLGAGILSRFNLVFDYAAQVVYFEHHAGSDRSDNYDRAGVWLNDAGDAFEVMGVVEGGPADDAGLAAGDLVTAIDGIPASELFLPDLRVRWRQLPPGTIVELAFRRDGQPRRASLTLRDLIAVPKHLAGG